MLSRELMGLFCLGVVWTTALLVAAAAWQELRDLHAIRRRARRAIVGVVEGEDLAEWAVVQTGRAIDRPFRGFRRDGDASGDEAIWFHDRTFRSRILGGRVRSGDVTYVVAPSDGQVWVDEKARADAAACDVVADFDAAHAQARKAKGFEREIRVRVRPGDRVWILGAPTEAPELTPEIVSTIDPSAFCARKALGFATFIPLELIACAAATRLALATPHFGSASTAGAIACLAFFLGVTPLGVALREGARRPHEAFLRTEWSRKRLAVTADHGVPQKN